MLNLGDNPCADCGFKNNIVWFVKNALWNDVMGEEKGKILCINCFVERAENRRDKNFSKITGWELKPEWKNINN